MSNRLDTPVGSGTLACRARVGTPFWLVYSPSVAAVVFGMAIRSRIRKRVAIPWNGYGDGYEHTYRLRA